METKICSYCKLEKNIDLFFEIRYLKRNLLLKSSCCIECSRYLARNRQRGIKISVIPDIVNLEGEIWRPINYIFKGMFHVSNFGRVKSINYRDSGKEYLVAPIKNSQGYVRYSLQYNKVRKTIFGHVLVARTFIENVHNKPQVNHLDGNKSNNRVENLEWVTSKENMQHAHDTGLMPKIRTNRSARYGNSKLRKPVLKLDRKGNVLYKYASVSETVKDGYNPSKVSAVCKGKRYYHRGFKWAHEADYMHK